MVRSWSEVWSVAPEEGVSWSRFAQRGREAWTRVARSLVLRSWRVEWSCCDGEVVRSRGAEVAAGAEAPGCYGILRK